MQDITYSRYPSKREVDRLYVTHPLSKWVNDRWMLFTMCNFYLLLSDSIAVGSYRIFCYLFCLVVAVEGIWFPHRVYIHLYFFLTLSVNETSDRVSKWVPHFPSPFVHRMSTVDFCMLLQKDNQFCFPLGNRSLTDWLFIIVSQWG